MKLTMMPEGSAWKRIRTDEEKVETGPMGNCVSCVAIYNKDVRGYHGLGGIKACNFDELREAHMDQPRAKIFVVYSREFDTVLRHVTEIIEEQNFQFIEWRMYQSYDAIVWRDGTVTNIDSKIPLPCHKQFISSMASKIKPEQPAKDPLLQRPLPAPPSSKPKSGMPTRDPLLQRPLPRPPFRPA
jgi:hypothetical protein